MKVKYALARARAAAHAAAYLMELREAELVGVLDYERVHVRYVYARLDYGRADEYLYAALAHVLHYPAELLAAHLAVGHGDGRAVHELGYLQRGAVNCVHSVVQIIDLAAAVELAAHRVAQHAPVVLHDECLHGKALHGRLLDSRHVAYAGEGHVERARYGRRRERQHVHLTAELLYMFLVRHAEGAAPRPTTRRPRSLNFTSFCSRRCVPMTRSQLPSASSAIDFFHLRIGAETAQNRRYLWDIPRIFLPLSGNAAARARWWARVSRPASRRGCTS